MTEQQTLHAALVQFAHTRGGEQEAEAILEDDRRYGGFHRRLELARAEQSELPIDRDDEWGHRARIELFMRGFVRQFQSLELVAKAHPFTNGAPRIMIEPHMWDDLLIFDFQNSALEEYFEGGTRFVGVRIYLQAIDKVSGPLAGPPRRAEDLAVWLAEPHAGEPAGELDKYKNEIMDKLFLAAAKDNLTSRQDVIEAITCIPAEREGTPAPEAVEAFALDNCGPFLKYLETKKARIKQGDVPKDFYFVLDGKQTDYKWKNIKAALLVDLAENGLPTSRNGLAKRIRDLCLHPDGGPHRNSVDKAFAAHVEFFEATKG